MKLPAGLSGQDLRRALERDDFVFQRQKGSHMILRREDPCGRIVVPDRPGTLRQILNQAAITVEKLIKLL